MKVAILGGGSAGVMAVVHLSRHFPHFDILHVLDRQRPPIGVGEGTTPGFRVWVEEIAPHSFGVLRTECFATVKRGVQFEKWGRRAERFVHDFVPRDNPGLHISASRLPAFLERFHRATIIDGRVANATSGEGGVTVSLEDGRTIQVDLLVDARGFPGALDGRHLALPWIPTDNALVTRGPPVGGLERTRAVARPHGWIFVIPLSAYTSYGYVSGSETAAMDQVEEDFSSFLSQERVEPTMAWQRLTFPNFLCHDVFDGRVFKIGNAASFIEPLEATSIALVRVELALLSSWLRARDASDGQGMAAALVAGVNERLRRMVIEVSVFIAWHYAAGSRFQTPFWANAARGFHRALRDGVPGHIKASFQVHRERALEFSAEKITQARTRGELDALLRGVAPLPDHFGGMTPFGFAQVAEGLGESS